MKKSIFVLIVCVLSIPAKSEEVKVSETLKFFCEYPFEYKTERFSLKLEFYEDHVFGNAVIDERLSLVEPENDKRLSFQETMMDVEMHESHYYINISKEEDCEEEERCHVSRAVRENSLRVDKNTYEFILDLKEGDTLCRPHATFNGQVDYYECHDEFTKIESYSGTCQKL